DNGGIKTSSHGRDATRESGAVDVAEVQVADEKGGAATPGWRQVRQPDGDAALSNCARIGETVDAGRNRGDEQDEGDPGPGSEAFSRGENEQYEVDQPCEDCRD